MSHRKLYHYTGAVAAAGVIQHGQFWANSVSFSNDRLEFSFGLECMIRRWYEKKPQQSAVGAVADNWKHVARALTDADASLAISHAPFHIICFNSIDPAEPDSLTSWLGYAGEAGICLELDLPQEHNYSIKGTTGTILAQLTPVGYLATSDPNKSFDNTDNAISDPSEFWADWENVIFIKKADFRHEREYRLVFKEKVVSESLQYRDAAGIEKAFVSVGFEASGKPGWPIRAVTVGPGRNQRQVFNSFRSLLNQTSPSAGHINVLPLGADAYEKAWQDCCDLWLAKVRNRIKILQSTDLITEREYSGQQSSRLEKLCDELIAFRGGIKMLPAEPEAYGAYAEQLIAIAHQYPEFKTCLAEHFPTRTGIVLHRSECSYRYR